MTPDFAKMLDDRTTRMECKLDHLAEAIGHYTDLSRRMEKAELAIISDNKRISSLEKWQAASMACLSLLCFIVMPCLVLLGPSIRIKLGLP